MTAKFSSSFAMFAIAAHTLANTSLSSDSSRPTMSSRPPTKLRTISPASLWFSIHGQIAQAALAWTSGFWFLSRDHNSRTPSNLSITLTTWQKQNTYYAMKLHLDEIYSFVLTSYFQFPQRTGRPLSWRWREVRGWFRWGVAREAGFLRTSGSSSGSPCPVPALRELQRRSPAPATQQLPFR